ncbi:MAG: EAL domain-containing protein, partial [Acidimicrobiia bacterium]|nr:EAL domain-containing protein [Acidimicrobiia bacterium]
VSVNVAPRQLRDPAFTGQVAAALEAAGLDPARLVLEITESAVIADAEEAAERLGAVRSLGVRIALDDFGTGYSSLSHLSTLPIDIVKIDRAFVDRLDKGPEESALARGILKIAATMDLETIAEGVERPGQVDDLELHGCGMGQGFYFGAPLPPADYERTISIADRRTGPVELPDRARPAAEGPVAPQP